MRKSMEAVRLWEGEEREDVARSCVDERVATYHSSERLPCPEQNQRDGSLEIKISRLWVTECSEDVLS